MVSTNNFNDAIAIIAPGYDHHLYVLRVQKVGYLESKTYGNNTLTVGYLYDDYGRVTSMTYNNSSSAFATWAYTARGQVGRYYDAGEGRTWTYTYDAAGHITSISDGTEVWSYTYDAQGQLLTETLGINLKRELIDDVEVYVTYENPLGNPANRFVKRLFDIVVSFLALLVMLPFLPILAIIIKSQSPGPIFFKQLRTGIDGHDFMMYKFRSMHVNSDADKVQATKDDPRKYAFGNFMRKTNIDELPQFWNVLKGDMSIVGPRPHMLAHTEMYSQLIDKYMVRHFMKPGVTGWAQVTGFRGETSELWQMEGRVKRDIWYMEHWSIWLDIRIIWLTFKSLFKRDEHAY